MNRQMDVVGTVLLGNEIGVSYSQLAPKCQDFLKKVEVGDVTRVMTFRGETGQRELITDFLGFTHSALQLALESNLTEQAENIGDLGENTYYIDTDSFSTATDSLARHWVEMANDGQKVIIFSGKDYKSEFWIAGKVLEKAENQIEKVPEEQKNDVRNSMVILGGDNTQSMNNMATEVASSEIGKCRIVVVDDLMITGISIRNKVGEIITKLQEMGINSDEALKMIEVNVVCGSDGPFHHKELDEVPIYSYYFVPAETRIPHMFGWWKSPDYGFRDVISEDVFGQSGIPGARGKLEAPKATEMFRPYKGKTRDGYADSDTEKMWVKLRSSGWNIRN